jgi:hypothetical protein
MKKESGVHETLDLFLGRYGVPEVLISDGAKAYTGGEFQKKAKQAGIFCKRTDPYSYWQKRAESKIREVKRLATRWIVRTKSPGRLWDHAFELASVVRSHLVLDLYNLNGQVPETIMLGRTDDISFICSYAWYDWVYYNEQTAPFPEPKMTLWRYLGPTDPAGSVLTAKILTMNGDVIRRNTFRQLERKEFDIDECKTAQKQFEEKIQKRLGEPIIDSAELSKSMNISAVAHVSTVYDEEEDDELQGTNESEVTDTSYDPDVMDTYITAQVLLPRGGNMKVGKVI